MGLLSLDEMLQPKNKAYEELEVPELGGTIRLKQLDAGRALDFQYLQAEKTKGADVNRKVMITLLCGAVVDENGKPRFNEQTAGKFISAVSFETLNLIAKKALSMIAPPKTEDGEAEDLAGN